MRASVRIFFMKLLQFTSFYDILLPPYEGMNLKKRNNF